MKKKKKLIIIIGIAALLLIIGIILLCVQLKPEKMEKIKKKTVKKDEPKVQIVDVNSKSRPYAVMINNLNAARQVQSGLSDAYMVYEIIVEGGITRYLALFKDQDTAKIGSVRSARHYYLDYVMENDAIFVHWGYSDQAKADIKTLGINNINGLTYEGTYFYRDNPLKLSSEHTGFTNMELLGKAVNKLKYRSETDNGLLLDYSAKSVKFSDSAVDANKVTLKYSNYIVDTYDYDENTKKYNRSVNGSAQKDFATSEQITAKNIIVYQVNNYTIAGDQKGRQFLENIGSGDGYFISEGKAVNIKWSKSSRESKTKYTFEDGKPLVVNDGNTFIQIMPLTGSITVE